MKNQNNPILNSPIIGYAHHRVILDDTGKPVDYEFLEVNTTFEKLTGLKANEIVGKTVTTAIPGIEKAEFDWIGFYGDVALQGGEKEFEQYSEPLKKWYRVHVYSTEKLFFTTMFVDITAIKMQTEELEAFFSVNLDLLCIADLEGNFIKTNQAWSRILGYSTEELNQRKFLEFVHLDDMEATLVAMATLGTGEDVLEFTNRYKCKDGSYRFIEWRSYPKGDLIYAAARDVTEKIEQEHRISDTNRMLQTILDTIPQHVFWKDRNSVYLGCNSQGARVAGVANPLDIVGKTDYDLAWKNEEADFFRACDQRVMANNAPELHIIESQLQADGKNAWLDTTKIPLHDDSGTVNGILVAFEDITEKRTADEEKLRQAGMIKSLLSSIPDIVFFKDCDGVYLGCNPLFAELVGKKSEEEVIGKTDYDLFDKELAEFFKHHDNEMLKQLTSLQNEEEVTFPDGRKILIDTLKTPYRDTKGNVIGILGVSRDITERKKSENALRESDSLLKNLTLQVPGVIYQYQVYPNGKACFPFASEHIKDIYEVTPEEVKDDSSIVIERLHQEDRERVVNKIMQSKEKLEYWEDEYRVTLPEKGERWLRGVANPEKLEDESVLWHGYIYDITQIKKEQLETERLKEQFELAVAGTNDGIWDWNIKTNELFLSKRWKMLLGYEDSEINNMFDSFISLIFEDDLPKVNNFVERYLKGEIENYAIEFRMKHKDGSLVWILAKGEALRDEKGIPYRMAGSHSDITERKEMEVELKENKERMQLAMDAGEHGFWDWNLITNNTYFSPVYYTMLGYKDKELPMNFDTFMKLIHPDDAKNVMPEMQQSIEAGKPYDVEFRLKCKDGSYKWIIGKGKTFFNEESGKPNRAVGVHLDINERKIAEEKLRESEIRFNAAIEGTEAGIWDWDMVANTVIFSKQWKAMLGYTDAEIENSFAGWKNLWHPDDVAAIEKALTDHMNGLTRKYEIVHRCRHKDGDWRWIMTRGKILRNADGKPCRWIGTNIDITYRKKAEEELFLSEQNQRILLDNIQTQIWYLTDETTYGTLNQAHADFNGVKIEDMAFKNLYDIFPKDIVDVCKQSNTEVFSAKKTVHTEEWAPHASGKKRLISIIKTPKLRDDGSVEYVVCSAEDITEQKQAEHTIQEQSELQKLLMAVSNEFINVPLNQTDETINTALATLGRFTNIDRSYIFHYDHEERVCNNTYEWCGDGIIPQVEQLQGIPFDAVPDWIEAHYSGKPMHIADVMALPADSGVRQVLEPQGIQSILALPMMDGNNCIGFVGFDAVKSKHIFSDNEQKLLQLFALMLVNIFNRNRIETELTASKQQAEAASKAKSEFLANMSHEIRTPLNGVIGFTDLLKNTQLSPVQQQYVNNANVSGHTLLDIINNILDFSKIEAGMLHLEMIKTDIFELLENSIDIVKYQAGKKNLELLLHIDQSMPRFAVTDPIRLKQILANLLGNAVKFTEKGDVELKVQFEALEDGNGKLSFFVRDTGIGITEEQKSKLFKAFSQADSSTTRKFGGTGLGLIISDLIAKKLGGKILVDSKQGEGTTFHFEIVTEIEEGDRRDTGSLELVKRCLIIDDNANNRLILEEMLANWSICCESCDNGLTALKLLETSKPFDVIICDYNMPYIDGLETIRMIRNKLKLTEEKQPIILLHSSSDDAELHKQCDELGVRFRLTKPVKGRDLHAYLCQVHEPEKNRNETSVSTTPIAQTALSGSVNILIAEDVKMNMMMIKALITQVYPEAVLHEAFNGLEVVRLMSEVAPDLILMDVQMPELDGLEATKKIRTLEKESGFHVPIVALTAGAFKEEEEKCLAAGMDDFLTKPVEPQKIRAVLEKHLIGKSDKVEQVMSEQAKPDAVHFCKETLLARTGSEDLVIQVIGIALNDFPEKLEKLNLSIQDGDIKCILEIAHQFKGAALNMGCSLIAELAATMEEMANIDENLPLLQEKYEELQAEWDILKDILEK